MKPFGKILVPVDLTRRSVGAARYAAGLGSEFQSELVFVHALRNGWPLSDTARRVRDVIMSFEGSTPGKFVKGLSLDCPIDKISYNLLRGGVMFASQDKFKFYPFLSLDDVERRFYRFWKSM